MTRLQKYIIKQKNQGKKRVSFFVNVKLWKYITRRSKINNMTIDEFLKYTFDFKSFN